MSICWAEDAPPTNLRGITFIAASHLEPDPRVPKRGDERRYDLTRTLIPVGPLAVGRYQYCKTIAEAGKIFASDNSERAKHEELMRELREKERLEKLAADSNVMPVTVPACVQGTVFHGAN